MNSEMKTDIEYCDKLSRIIYDEYLRIRRDICIYNMFDYKISDTFIIDCVELFIRRDPKHETDITSIHVNFEKTSAMYQNNEEILLSSNMFDVLEGVILEETNTKKNNAFNMFCKDERPVLKDKHPTLTSKEISKELSLRWKQIKKENTDIFLDYINKSKTKRDSNLQKIFNTVYNILCVRKKYTYSKTLDSLILNEEIEVKEEEKSCVDYICAKERIECCVCFEQVSTNSKTWCNHYICRECVGQLKEYKCPMCRRCYCGICEECI